MKKLNKQIGLILLIGILLTACKKEVNVTGVALNKTSLTLIIGNTETLTVEVSPADAEDKSVMWTSSNDAVATVNGGIVTAIGEGNATITVETSDGGFTATCSVIVEPVPVDVTSVVLNETTVNLKVDDTKQLTATITPSNATDKTVTWSSSSDAIATVDANGLVTGVSTGTATITATTNNGSKTATCEFNVYQTGSITEIMTQGFLVNDGLSLDLECDANGIPYIAYYKADASLSEKSYVQIYKYNGSGTAWSQFSDKNVAICNNESPTPSLAIKNDGSVFVSYQYYDDINDNRYDHQIVSTYDGSNWITLGGEGNLNNNCLIMNGSDKLTGETEMAFKQDGTLMLILETYGYAYVYYYSNGGDWTMPASGQWLSYSGYTTNSSSFWMGGVNIATHGNKPYVFTRTGSGDGICGVLTNTETNGEKNEWDWLGTSIKNIVTRTTDYETPLAISSTGEIYTAYQKSDGTDAYAHVAHYNSTEDVWVSMYSTMSSQGYFNDIDVVVSNDVLYFACANYDGSIDIYKYNSENEKWFLEGSTPDLNYVYYNIKLSAGTNGEFYIAYTGTDDGKDHKIGVFKYTPAQ